VPSDADASLNAPSRFRVGHRCRVHLFRGDYRPAEDRLPGRELTLVGAFILGEEKMKTRLRSVLAKSAVAGVLAAGVGVGVMPPTAALAVGCTGDGCQGKDPNSNGCGSTASYVSGTGHYLYGDDVYVEMRKSSGCKARWARVTIDNGNHVTVKITIERQVESPYGWFTDSDSTHTKSIANMGVGQFWTSMAPDDSEDRFEVCVSDNSNNWCSAWKA
jgi:hypothetical protein